MLLIGCLWVVGHQLWEHHNSVLHHGLTIPRFLCKHHQHANTVWLQFVLGLGVLNQRYAWWFQGMVDDLLNQPRWFTAAWLWNVNVAHEHQAW